MTQKTTYKRAKSGFDMAEITSRIKKRFRKRHKKTVKKSKIRQVWKDYVELMITEPLVQKGKVQIDKKFWLEIVGERIVDNPRAVRFLTEVLPQNKNSKVKMNQSRPGFIFKVVMTEERFKEGKLMYEPSQNIEKAVKNALKNTNTYYRINVNK